MLFCCLWRNIETSCHKHVVVVSRHQQIPPLTTSDKCHNLPLSGGVVLIAALTARDEARYWLRISISAYSICIRRPCSGVPVEMLPLCLVRKPRMVWLADGEKNLTTRLFVSRECMNERDMDRRTDIACTTAQARTCIASRGKNWTQYQVNAGELQLAGTHRESQTIRTVYR